MPNLLYIFFEGFIYLNVSVQSLFRSAVMKEVLGAGLVAEETWSMLWEGKLLRSPSRMSESWGSRLLIVSSVVLLLLGWYTMKILHFFGKFKLITQTLLLASWFSSFGMEMVFCRVFLNMIAKLLFLLFSGGGHETMLYPPSLKVLGWGVRPDLGWHKSQC